MSYPADGARDDSGDTIATDLIQYLVVAVPDVGSLAGIVPALAELTEARLLRILDLAVLARDGGGAVTVLELEEVASLATLQDVEGDVGGLLSDGDIEFVSFAIRPASAGLVLVVEDRWARPLALAAARSGGRVIAGERIPSGRVETVLADAARDDQEI